MEWSDRGIVLSARKHGEASVILELLTGEHGRHMGLVRGGAGRRMRGVLQPGNEVDATWRARLAEHLGAYTAELAAAHAAALLERPIELAALSAACAMASRTLPERELHGAVYEGLLALIGELEHGGDDWRPAAADYVRWEIGLLGELGFGLDLEACAVTGERDGLAYVSPRSGRAVSTGAAGDYRDRLLPLPGFLIGGGAGIAAGDIAQGLALSGFFISRHLLEPYGWPMPPARARYAERVGKFAE